MSTENKGKEHWTLALMKKIKHSILVIGDIIVRAFKGVLRFIKKRWKLLVGLIAAIVIIVASVAWGEYYIDYTLPQKKENKAVDIVESKFHSDDPAIKLSSAYGILKSIHSDNFDEFIYLDDIKFGVVRKRYQALQKEAFDYIQKEAFAGDAEYQSYLGDLYYFKEDYVENDNTKAAYWWNEAALQGYVGAYNNIGLCYRDGTGVNKDLKLAVEWLKKGAEAGESYAQYNYANMFLEGAKIQIGSHKKLKPGYNPNYYNKYDLFAWEDVPDYEILIEKDIDVAKYWWKLSAEQGNSLAIEALQKIYN